MSLTNVNDATAERLVKELFDGEIAYVPYSRPGFPLARSVSGMVDRIPSNAIGHDAGASRAGHLGRRCRAVRTRGWCEVVGRIEEYVAACRRGRQCWVRSRGDARHRGAATGSPSWCCRSMRGALGVPERVILHFDDSDDVPADARRRSGCPSWRGGGWRRRSTCSAPAGCRSGSTST